jgi:CheY-like chemotaxis protein
LQPAPGRRIIASDSGSLEHAMPAFRFEDPDAPCSLLPVFGDPIDFNDDPPEGAEAGDGGAAPWVVLIVDDDPNVHDATLLALHGERVARRPLAFRHAYATAEARKILAGDADVAVVLLDVVMESADAGLKLVRDIRENPGRHDIKIIVRTGQPGRAPEAKVRNDFAIDGYITKATLTRAMLLQALTQVLQPDDASGGPAPH